MTNLNETLKQITVNDIDSNIVDGIMWKWNEVKPMDEPNYTRDEVINAIQTDKKVNAMFKKLRTQVLQDLLEMKKAQA